MDDNSESVSFVTYKEFKDLTGIDIYEDDYISPCDYCLNDFLSCESDCFLGIFVDLEKLSLKEEVDLEKVSTETLPEELNRTQSEIVKVCDSIKEKLLEKNRKYGDSAIHPKRIFSSASPIEQINVRIDDKLSRIQSAQDDDTEDAEFDLIGYLVLKAAAKEIHKEK